MSNENAMDIAVKAIFEVMNNKYNDEIKTLEFEMILMKYEAAVITKKIEAHELQ